MINATINQFLTKQLPNLKIAVVGDVMVDRYVFGDVSRISPEAPVPVNRVSKNERGPWWRLVMLRQIYQI